MQNPMINIVNVLKSAKNAPSSNGFDISPQTGSDVGNGEASLEWINIKNFFNAPTKSDGS